MLSALFLIRQYIFAILPKGFLKESSGNRFFGDDYFPLISHFPHLISNEVVYIKNLYMQTNYPSYLIPVICVKVKN